jgi:WD40 repeat protein
VKPRLYADLFRPMAVAVADNGTLFAGGTGGMGSLCAWPRPHSAETCSLLLKTDREVYAVACHKSKAFVAHSGGMTVYSTDDLAVLAEFYLHQCNCLAISPNGRLFAGCGGWFSAIRVVCLATHEVSDFNETPAECETPHFDEDDEYTHHRHGIVALEVVPNRRLLSAGEDRTVKVWGTDPPYALIETIELGTPVTAIACTDDRLYTAHATGVTVWSLESYRPIGVTVAPHPIIAMVMTPLHSLVCVAPGHVSGSLVSIQFPQHRPPCRYKHRSPIRGICLHKNKIYVGVDAFEVLVFM